MMCSERRTMENYQGDLTDILRAAGNQTAAEAAAAAALQDWQLPSHHAPPLIYAADPRDDFGDPFSHQLRDPLLLHGTIDNDAVSGFFHGSSDINIKSIGADEMKIRPNNMFSRMLQIAPNAKLMSPENRTAAAAATAATGGGGGGPTLLSDEHVLVSPNSATAKGCLVESSLQISSPRNTGIRRRKSQAKKVVCIPAPAPANSRSSGEIVPSDLWAWRKYGQKPIKGSPYPRGYYRCSSSKGCSARKQVERSRTDPNMLVITYTSEHNHPWPTQRNALAGSTRSQPNSKTNNPTTKPTTTSSPSTSHKCKQEQKEITTEEEEEENTLPPPPPSSSAVIKEENMDQDHYDSAEFDDQGFPLSYRPMLPRDNISHSEDSFFADLEEIDGDDSLDLLLTQGFSGDGGKSLDPFSFYDWATAGNTTTTTTTSDDRPPPPTTTAAATSSRNDDTSS